MLKNNLAIYQKATSVQSISCATLQLNQELVLNIGAPLATMFSSWAPGEQNVENVCAVMWRLALQMVNRKVQAQERNYGYGFGCFSLVQALFG